MERLIDVDKLIEEMKKWYFSSPFSVIIIIIQTYIRKLRNNIKKYRRTI